MEDDTGQRVDLTHLKLAREYPPPKKEVKEHGQSAYTRIIFLSADAAGRLSYVCQMSSTLVRPELSPNGCRYACIHWQ